MADDAYGMALKDFLKGKKNATIKVESEEMETEEWPVSQFFRGKDEMDDYERLALSLCSGRTLDVGAGAGSHTLCLQEQGLQVVALDKSDLACEVMRSRGAKEVVCGDFFSFQPTERFDTLLFMMNGAGLCETLDRLPELMKRCHDLLNVGGQALMDSSDLIYLFQDDDGETWLPMNGGYYGEVHYTMSYRNIQGQPFGWLFVGYDILSEAAMEAGLRCEKLHEDDNNHYLARLTR